MTRGALALAACLAAALACAPATAVAGEVVGGATWRAEQPIPAGSSWPASLGKIGEIAFWAPDRGLLITEGEPPTVPAGVWAYNGVEWHELASVCGATDGRIAWADGSEFWTVSNGRAGQANEVTGNGVEVAVPLQDNTLCHFAHGQLVGSYAHLANEVNSYQAMHAAACLAPTDCWFAGDPLPEPQIGAFHLHWNGSALENEPYLGEGHAIESMSALEGHLYEGAQIVGSDRVESGATEAAVHRINPEGVAPAIQPEEGLFGEGLPLYAPGEPPGAIEALQLSSAGDTLWAAAGRSAELLEPSQTAGQVTVARMSARVWTQLIGPEHPLGPIMANAAEERALLGLSAGEDAADATVSAIAAEPGTEDAWLALAPRSGSSAQQRAVLVHISAQGEVLETQILPAGSEQIEGVGAKGAAARLTCPQADDCWLATTQGWLYHLAPEGERSLARDPGESEYFTGLITYRPPDQGLPQIPPDAPPPDNSGLVEEAPDYGGTFAETKVPPVESKVQAPLLSDVHSRLVHGTTLELRFRLAVRARVRLLAKRHKQVVASTPPRTLAAGERKLLLRLNRRAWPTKLSLQTHALAPLPTTTVKESVGGPEHGGGGSNTISTGLTALPTTPSFAEPGPRL